MRLLDETRALPAIAVAYDLLDVFGLGAGGLGIVLFGNGAGGGGFGVVGGNNATVQSDPAVAGKHFGPEQITPEPTCSTTTITCRNPKSSRLAAEAPPPTAPAVPPEQSPADPATPASAA